MADKKKEKKETNWNNKTENEGVEMVSLFLFAYIPTMNEKRQLILERDLETAERHPLPPTAYSMSTKLMSVFSIAVQKCVAKCRDFFWHCC